MLLQLRLEQFQQPAEQAWPLGKNILKCRERLLERGPHSIEGGAAVTLKGLIQGVASSKGLVQLERVGHRMSGTSDSVCHASSIRVLE